MTKDSKYNCQNSGYALLTQNGETLALTSKSDRFHQFQYQLYHYSALGIKFQDSLSGKNVLDLCCGRGGGLAFLARHFKAASALGIDFSSHQIATAQDKYAEVENLSYVQADVESLAQVEAVQGKKFDLVTCIESYHCLRNESALLKQTYEALH